MKLTHLIFRLLSDLVIIVCAIEFLCILLRYSLPCSEIYVIYFCKLKLVRTAPMSSEYLKTSKESYELYKKYQNTIHGVSLEKLTEQQYTRFLVKSPLQVISRCKLSVEKPPVMR